MKIKTIIIKPVHQIWHFIAGPTKSNPFQFITIQPIMTPMMPKRAVEAPAFTPTGETTILKIFPDIPEIRQMTSVLQKPQVCQTLDRNMKVVITLPKRCRKQTWRNMAEINRQTSPASTSLALFPPYRIRVSYFTCRRFGEDLSKPAETQKMNKARSASRIRNVKERHLRVGQRAKAIMSQQFSSQGFFTCFLPEIKRTLCQSATLRCSATTGQPRLSRKPG